MSIQSAHDEPSSPDARSRLRNAFYAAQHGRLKRQTFLDALENEDPEVRLEAVQMLGQIGASWAIESLGERLDDEESYVRNEVIFALSSIGRPAVVPWLIKALRDEDEERVEDARVALIQVLGDPVAPILAQFGEGTGGEAVRAAEWWKSESWRYNDGTVYHRGEPASLAVWVATLRGASDAGLHAIAERLKCWTGQDFGSPSSPGFADRWEGWWGERGAEFQPGRRYFYGRPVDESDLK